MHLLILTGEQDLLLALDSPYVPISALIRRRRRRMSAEMGMQRGLRRVLTCKFWLMPGKLAWGRVT